MRGSALCQLLSSAVLGMLSPRVPPSRCAETIATEGDEPIRTPRPHLPRRTAPRAESAQARFAYADSFITGVG